MDTHLKIYYHFSELFAIKRFEKKTSSKIKNLFLYFDYEREFSGFETDITDEDVKVLVDKLSGYGFKSTWFTVGKVIENYPMSIEYILSKHNEIGSHTFSHISPKEISTEMLLDDLQRFQKIKEKHNLNLMGFHSPKNRWNISMFKQIANFGYSYDIFPPKQRKSINGNHFECFEKDGIFRMITLGDDWPLYGADNSREEVFDFFISIYKEMKPGSTCGIGAHPWVLYSDKRILQGYYDFLEFLSQQNDLKIETAYELSKKLQSDYVKS